jgi:quercetin dioxygenase-like cupin family protein
MRWISVAALFFALAAYGVIAPMASRTALAQESAATPGTLEIAPGVTAEEVVIPAGEPQIFRFHFERGSTVSFDDTDPSISLVYVETGTLTATFQGPISISRAAAADAPDEPVAAGQKFTATTGDYFVAPGNTAVELRNDGAEPLTLLIATLIPTAPAGGVPMGTPASS